MTTYDKNKLAFHYKTALENYTDAKVKEENENFDYELTMSRCEASGFIDGFEFGAIAGFRHAIALLQAEEFTEHAQILESQLIEILEIFEAGE
jgi:hypothetical protein